MAELHVQPKRKNFWWLWLVLTIIIIAGLIYIYYFVYFEKGKAIGMGTTNDSTYALQHSTDNTGSGVSAHANLWDQTNFNSPDTTFTEVTDKNVTTKSNAHFVIYSLNTRSLFEDDKSDLSNEGKQSLNQIGASINQRFNTSDVRIYAQSNTAHENPLALERGESISDYLVKNSNLDQSRISIYHPGEGTEVPGNKNTVHLVVKR